MTLALCTPEPADLPAVVEALRTWQDDVAPVPLHPGDVGWHGAFGEAKTAAALRTWRQAGDLVAVGLLDGPGLVRLAVAPASRADQGAAHQIAADLTDASRGVLPMGEAAVEARGAVALQATLQDQGWRWGEPWTPLRHGVPGERSAPEESRGSATLRVVPVQGDEAIESYCAVHRSAFASSWFTPERWRTMVSGSAYREGTSLLGYDVDGAAVAGVTIWSAGVGRPGLLEPMGVHADHRERGYGVAICRAAAERLRGLGASSAIVSTPKENVGAVRTYVTAGYAALPDEADLVRPPA